MAEAKRAIAIVTACLRPDGTPAFDLNTVEVTPEEEVNGIHYYLVEALLLEKGLDEPFVHFDDREAPAFLLPAVRAQLALSSENIILEEVHATCH